MKKENKKEVIDKITKIKQSIKERQDKRKLDDFSAGIIEEIKKIKAGKDGRDGLNGEKGKDGRSIVGPKGDKGEKGERGEIGPIGKGEKGERGPKGEKGDKGDSIIGPQGPAGKTPKKGEDYFTEAEVKSIVDLAVSGFKLSSKQVIKLLSDPKIPHDERLSVLSLKDLNRLNFGGSGGFSSGGGGGAGGSTTFIGLTDTPDTYVGQGGKGVRVNAGATALEFYTVVDTDEKVKYAADDASAGYLGAKTVAGQGIALSEGLVGDADKLVIATSFNIDDYLTEATAAATYQPIGSYVDGSGSANQVTYWSDSGTVTSSPSHTVASGASPETRLTETTNSEYTRLTKLGSASSYVATRLNRVNVVGGTGNAVNLVKASNQYVNVPDSSAFTFGNGSSDTPFSISMWVYMTDATLNGFITKGGASNYEWAITSEADDKIYFDLYTLNGAGYIEKNTSSAITSLENTWAHIVVTYSGNGSNTGMKIYVNGSLQTMASGGSGYTAMNNGTHDVEIGRRFGGTSYDFAGKIDEVVIYNTELSAETITTMYNSGTGTYTTATANTLAIWHFDESAGTSATDSSGNSHTGTLQNSATFVTGKIATASAVAEVQVWKSQDGTNALEQGIHTWGNSAGRSVIAGDARIDNLTTNGLVYTSGGAGKLYTHAGLSYDDTTRTLNLNTLAGAGALKINDSTYYSTLDFIPTSVRGWRMMTGNNSTDGIDLTTYVSSSNGSVASLTAVMKLTNNGIVFGAGTNTVSGNGNIDVKGGTINLGDAYATGSAGSWGTKLRLGNTNNLILHLDTSTAEGAVSIDTTNSTPYNYMQVGTLTAHGLMLKTNGVHRVDIDSAGNIVINEDGLSTSDLRVEGDTDANLLFVDASADKVGIGMNNPSYKFDVTGDINASGVYRAGGTAGVSGSFITADAKTVTVTNGIITSIV